MELSAAWRRRATHVQKRLARCQGGFQIEAAAAVLGRDGAASTSSDALAIVAGLIDKSLLLRADTSVASRPLYQMSKPCARTGLSN